MKPNFTLLKTLLLGCMPLVSAASLHAADSVPPAAQGAGVQAYSPHANAVDVTKAPYMAKGDGTTDDSDALQHALNDHVGRHHVLYFPKGTYLVSRTLAWPKEWGGHQKWGFTTLRGQERDTTSPPAARHRAGRSRCDGASPGAPATRCCPSWNSGAGPGRCRWHGWR